MQNTKNLIKISYMIFVVVIKYCSGTDDFVLINKYEEDKYYCITNTSSALSWILDDTSSNTNLIQESRFLPTSENLLKITCSTVKEPCQESFANNITLDRRWEKFPIYKTDYVEDESYVYSPLKLTTVEQNLKNNFVVPLSVSFLLEADLFLCEGNNITTSNCYWLIIDGFIGIQTGIRKCPQNTIPSLSNMPIKGPCRTLKMGPRYTSPQHLSREHWKHFKLIKINNWITLTNLNDEIFISFNDTENAFNVKYMIIHNRYTSGLWKIHKLKYFYFTKEGELWQQEVKPIQDVVCISAFVKMCDSCSILVEIKNGKMGNNVLGSQTYQLQTSDWKEIKFIKTDIKAKDVILIFTAISSQKENIFWAIDGIYQCAKDGFRMITLNETAHCQILSSNSPTIPINDYYFTLFAFDTFLIDELHECDEHTVGKFCIPCQLFLNKDCGKLKFCEFHNKKHLCSCSAGYQTKDSYYCNSRCENGKYGWNCRKQCSEYCVDCNNIDGTCQSCTNNYEGRMCDQTPPLIFKEAPTVVNYTYNEALIEMKNFDFSRKVHPTESTYVQFRIQYKMDGDKESWIDGEKHYDINQQQTIYIRNLTAGKKYFVRSIIYLNGNPQESAEIPQNKFTTKCDVAKVNELKVNVSNTSVTVTIKEEHQFRICQFHNDKIRLEVSPPAKKFSYALSAKTIHINGLDTFSNYSIKIIEKNTNKFLISIIIHTTEVPEQILEPVAENITDTSITLRWVEPNIHGKLKHYFVTYQIVKHLGCKNPLLKPSQKQQQETQNTFITLSDLSPYKEYEFTIFAANLKFKGPPQTIHGKTLESRNFFSGIIFDEEFSEIKVTTQPSTRSVIVGFSSVICDKLRGPLLVVLNAICFETWCKNGSATHQFNFDSTSSTTIADIWPFTKYTLQLKFCRNQSSICSENFQYETFETKPEPPSPVKDLLVYKKNNHSISIRWKPPHPPTGVMELYNIHIYSGYLNFNRNVNVTNSSCSLWNDFQCFTVNDLKNDVHYTIDIKAKNKLPENLGQQATISTITKTERSQKPGGLTLQWSLKNDLLIKWKHPTEANGDIQFFEINIFPPANYPGHEIRYNYTVNKEKFRPIYTHTIPANDLLNSVAYKITIRAFNDLFGEFIAHIEWSPPKIPLFDSEPNVTSSDGTIRIKTSKIKMLNSENKYKLFLLLLDDIKNRSHSTIFQNLENSFDIQLATFKILYECDPSSDATEFIIGKTNNSISKCKNNANLSLTPATTYNITILLVNDDGRKKSFKFYSYEILTDGEIPTLSKNLRWLALLLLLLITPIIIIIFIKRKTVRSNDPGRSVDEETPLTVTANFPTNNPSPVEAFHKYVKNAFTNENIKAVHKEIINNAFSRQYTTVEENINWDYIDLHLPRYYSKAYMVSTIPTTNFDEFWEIIWDENVKNIICLDSTKLNKNIWKKYWPEGKETLYFNNNRISVSCISWEKFRDYKQLTFSVTCDNQNRTIQQLHFMSWPYKEIPNLTTEFNVFLEKVTKIIITETPIVILSEKDVEGAGVVLVCDICLRTGKEVENVAQILANYNIKLISNLKYYAFAHLAILEYLLSQNVITKINCKNFDPKSPILPKQREIELQLHHMKKLQWVDQTIKNVKRGVFDLNNGLSASNEEQHIYVKPVNIISVDDPNTTEKFIVTQQPRDDSLYYFWKLVEEKNISMIVSLNSSSEQLCWWPDERQPYLQVKQLKLLHKETKKFSNYFWITIYLHNNQKKMSVDIFSLKNWPPEINCPESVKSFVNFYIESSKIWICSNPVLVTCWDGMRACGLYLALYYITQKLKQEEICDICSSVRILKSYRQEYIKYDEQFMFLWEATEMFLKENDLYETVCNF